MHTHALPNLAPLARCGAGFVERAFCPGTPCLLALGPFTRRFSDAHNFKKQTLLSSPNRVVSILWSAPDSSGLPWQPKGCQQHNGGPHMSNMLSVSSFRCSVSCQMQSLFHLEMLSQSRVVYSVSCSLCSLLPWICNDVNGQSRSQVQSLIWKHHKPRDIQLGLTSYCPSESYNEILDVYRSVISKTRVS